MDWQIGNVDERDSNRVWLDVSSIGFAVDIAAK
jgi:hypothetical protein